jgi:ribosomal protein L12E/L44/L45/RPP1/RPP2
METVYAALLNWKVSKAIDQDTIMKILEAAGAQVDAGQVQALVAGLADKNLDELIASASAAPVAAAAPAAAPAAGGDDKKKGGKKGKEEPEEKKKNEEPAGLSSLFG